MQSTYRLDNDRASTLASRPAAGDEHHSADSYLLCAGCTPIRHRSPTVSKTRGSNCRGTGLSMPTYYPIPLTPTPTQTDMYRVCSPGVSETWARSRREPILTSQNALGNSRTTCRETHTINDILRKYAYEHRENTCWIYHTELSMGMWVD